jgi:hypothetical protein
MAFENKPIIMAVALLAALWLGQGAALACGTVDGWAATYERGERHKALFYLIDCADSYQAPRDDLLLLPIVADALGRRSKVAEMGVQVFLHYNHLYGARRQPAYAGILARIKKMGTKVNPNQFKDWLVVTAKNGANMRAAPNTSAKVLTALKFGMQAKPLARQGDWVKVKPVGPGAVDPRFDRYTGWVHQSLLAPY